MNLLFKQRRRHEKRIFECHLRQRIKNEECNAVPVKVLRKSPTGVLACTVPAGVTGDWVIGDRLRAALADGFVVLISDVLL